MKLFFLILFPFALLAQMPTTTKYWNASTNNIIVVGTDTLIAIGTDTIKLSNIDWSINGYIQGIPLKTKATFTQYHNSIAVDTVFFNRNVHPCTVFGNVDYLNQIYFKFTNAVLDVNGCEDVPKQITEIAIYDTALTGLNIKYASVYFGVPDKDLTALEVGAGKTYATVQLAVTAATAGDTIYIYSQQVYNETSFISVGKTVHLKGVGYWQNEQGGSSAYAFLLSNASGTSISGMTYANDGTRTYFIFDNGTDQEVYLSNNYLNLNSYLNYRTTTSTGWTMNNCVTNKMRWLPGITITSCYLMNNYDSKCTLPLVLTNNLCTNLNGQPIFRIGSASCISKGNTYKVKNDAFQIALTHAGDSLSMRHDTLISDDTAIESYITKLDTSTGYTLYIYDCYFINNIATGNAFIRVYNVGFECISNSFICNFPTAFSNAYFTHYSGVYNVQPCKMNYNYSYSNYMTGNGLFVGAEDTTTNVWNGCEIIGNHVIAGFNYNPLATGFYHNIFYNNGYNAVIKYNISEDGQYGYVIKNGKNNLPYTSGGVFYNLAINCTRGFHFAGMSDCNIYNNTVVNDINHSTNSMIGFYVQGNNEEIADSIRWSKNLTFRNNLYFTDLVNTSIAYYLVIQDGTERNGITIENALVYGSNEILWVGGQNYTALAECQDSSWLANSINANPSLTNEYRLKNGSVALGSGLKLPYPYNIGLLENRQPLAPTTINQGNIWDLGAYPRNIRYPLISNGKIVTINNQILVTE